MARSQPGILYAFDNRLMQGSHTGLRQTWDLFCRVVDNFGDAGVCWRLACQLGSAGHLVRLVIDDPAPLAWMAPDGAHAYPGVQVLPWPGPAKPGDVVIEAFGCDVPAATVLAMAHRPVPPVWINLEYLSAETYVERSHGLPSPQRTGPTKWFFYPGFTARTGGLLREPERVVERASFDRQHWLQDQGLAVQPGERVVSLFCYDNPALPALLQNLARQPTLLLLTQGHAQRQVHQILQAAPGQHLPGLRVMDLPWLSQRDFDHLLWSCHLNFVRGEDSLVRALWAGVPFIWQAYPQDDGAHLAKLQALLAQWQAPPEAEAAWWAWNGASGSGSPAAWPDLSLTARWAGATAEWRSRLLAQPDLASQLQAFVRAAAPASVTAPETASGPAAASAGNLPATSNEAAKDTPREATPLPSPAARIVGFAPD